MLLHLVNGPTGTATPLAAPCAVKRRPLISTSLIKRSKSLSVLPIRSHGSRTKHTGGPKPDLSCPPPHNGATRQDHYKHRPGVLSSPKEKPTRLRAVKPVVVGAVVGAARPAALRWRGSSAGACGPHGSVAALRCRRPPPAHRRTRRARALPRRCRTPRPPPNRRRRTRARSRPRGSCCAACRLLSQLADNGTLELFYPLSRAGARIIVTRAARNVAASPNGA